MFVDRVSLSMRAGNGGNGAIAWRREKYIPKGGPAGGNGGEGGSVIIRADSQLRSLENYRNRRSIKAENGGCGSNNNKQGKKGVAIVIKVPCGTLVKDPSGTILCDLTKHDQEFIACTGGKGGIGNTFFKMPTNQAPNKCTPGKEGTSLNVELELKLIADIGFLGLPNAGKSTLLSSIGYADVKVGAYPFTTLSPNLLTIEFDDYSRIRIADIPGIIAGAHEGKGLGHEFLRHIERTSVLVFIIDTSGLDGRDPIDDLATLRHELESYSPVLIERPSLIVLNKIDIDESNENIPRFANEETCLISAKEGKGVAELLEKMRELAQANGKKFI